MVNINKKEAAKIDLNNLIEETIQRVLKEEENDVEKTSVFYCIKIKSGTDKISIKKIEFDAEDMRIEGIEDIEEYEQLLKDEEAEEAQEFGYNAICVTAS